MPADLAYEPVWRVLKKVRPNFNPSTFFNVGVLTVSPEKVSFRSDNSKAHLVLPIPNDPESDIEITRVISVRRSRYGWGLVPRFVAIEYESDAGTRTAYFNDGGWMGWRPLLTGSNRRMAGAIRQQLSLDPS